MRFKINSYYSAKDISDHIDHHNHQFGMRSTPIERRIESKKYDVFVTVMFGSESYENKLVGDELKYHMQDGMKRDGTRKKPSKINFEVKDNGGAHIFLEVKKYGSKYKYIGFRKLNRFDLANRYMYFDIIPESFNESLLYASKNSISNLRKNIKHIIGLPAENSEVIYDYMSDTLLPLEFEEGNVSHAIVKIRKRNNNLRIEAIKKRGRICQICGENLPDKYGDEAVVHVHHINPLSTFKTSSHNSSIKDVLVLCPSCHAVFHKNPKKVKTPNEMKELVSKGTVGYTFK